MLKRIVNDPPTKLVNEAKKEAGDCLRGCRPEQRATSHLTAPELRGSPRITPVAFYRQGCRCALLAWADSKTSCTRQIDYSSYAL